MPSGTGTGIASAFTGLHEVHVMIAEKQNNILAFPNSPLSKNRTDFLQRMNQWLVRSYGISIEYFEAFELGEAFLQTLSASASHREGNKISLPVRLDQGLIGSLRVTLPGQITQENMEQASELIHCIVLPYLEHLKRAQDLRAQEQRLSAPEGSAHRVFLSPDREELEAEGLLRPLFVLSPDAEAVRRKAIDLHDHSGNLIFLPFEDLDMGTRMNVNSLLELTRTTIFVSSLERKARKDLAAVLDILRGEIESIPFFIFGSAAPLDEVARSVPLNREESGRLAARTLVLPQNPGR